MPTTRRRRANPPDQPENNTNNHLSDQQEAAAPPTPEASAPEQSPETAAPAGAEQAGSANPPSPQVTPAPARPEQVSYQATFPTIPSAANGERQQEYAPTIEGGRRTARGELFRRPPQLPPNAHPVSAMAAAPLQAPSHEINLPLGNLLHLAYNPSYTGAEEARSALLRKLVQDSKSGGRARCWNCGSIAIAYDLWNTRNRHFGEVGVALCEICGVWSVM